MNRIGTKTHGYLDYIVGLLLIGAPWIFDFSSNRAETWVPVFLGAGTIIYSLMTDYELGLSKIISMRTHLSLDLAAGIFLAASPWLFGFANYVWAPHLVVGMIEISVVLLTKTNPALESVKHRRRQQRTARGF